MHQKVKGNKKEVEKKKSEIDHLNLKTYESRVNYFELFLLKCGSKVSLIFALMSCSSEAKTAT